MPPLIFLFPFGCSLSFNFNKFPHFSVTFFFEANHAVAVVLILCFGGDAKFEYWVTFQQKPLKADLLQWSESCFSTKTALRRLQYY